MTDRRIGDHVRTKTAVADVALEGNRFVQIVTATGTEGALPHVVYPDAGEVSMGVSRDAVEIGKLVDVVTHGVPFVLTSENIDAGQPVSADTDGKAQVATSSDIVLGIAEGAANTGTYVKVRLSPGSAV